VVSLQQKNALLHRSEKADQTAVRIHHHHHPNAIEQNLEKGKPHEHHACNIVPVYDQKSPPHRQRLYDRREHLVPFQGKEKRRTFVAAATAATPSGVRDETLSSYA